MQLSLLTLGRKALEFLYPPPGEMSKEEFQFHLAHPYYPFYNIPEKEMSKAQSELPHVEITDALGRKLVIGLRNASEGVNPKDRIGALKVDLTLIPVSAKLEMAKALMDGAYKYGPYNWRVEPVQIMTYLGAAERHLDAYRESEEVAPDSLVHHLGHVMACCAIIIDAVKQGKAVDNRPINGQPFLIYDANNFAKATIERKTQNVATT